MPKRSTGKHTTLLVNMNKAFHTKSAMVTQIARDNSQCLLSKLHYTPHHLNAQSLKKQQYLHA